MKKQIHMDTGEGHPALESTQENQLPVWLRVDQATGLYGLSRSKIYDLCTRGKITHISLKEEGMARGTRLIQRESLDRYLAQFLPPTSNH